MAKFQPGQSGNPGGRPKGVRSYVHAKCGADGKKAIDALYKLATGKKTPPAVQLQAWRELLDRGWGKAAQPITGDEDGVGGPILVRFVDVPAA
jgi:hypothetical protein